MPTGTQTVHEPVVTYSRRSATGSVEIGGQQRASPSPRISLGKPGGAAPFLRRFTLGFAIGVGALSAAVSVVGEDTPSSAATLPPPLQSALASDVQPSGGSLETLLATNAASSAVQPGMIQPDTAASFAVPSSQRWSWSASSAGTDLPLPRLRATKPAPPVSGQPQSLAQARVQKPRPTAPKSSADSELLLRVIDWVARQP
jgi:hypothetical protein